jgi:type II secretory pathway component GspD/PulD (secretin)
MAQAMFRGERKERGTMNASRLMWFTLLVLGLVVTAAGVYAEEETTGRGGFGKKKPASTTTAPPKEEKKAETAPATPAPVPAKAEEAAPAPATPAATPAPKPARKAKAGKGTVEEQRLDEVAKEMSLKEQADFAEADGVYKAGLAAYDDAEYEQAIKLFSQTLDIYPNHDGAREMLEKVSSMLGERRDEVASVLKKMSQERRAKVQEALLELRNAVEKAAAYESQANSFQTGDTDLSKETLLTRKMQNLDNAIELYDRVLEIVKWMPFEVDLSAEKASTAAKRAAAITAKKQAQEDLKNFQRDRALKEASSSKEREKMFHADRIRTMLEQAKLFLSREQFTDCEELCARILKIDPLNTDASGLMERSRQKRHQVTEALNYKEIMLERAESMTNVDAVSVPYSKRIIYPEDWERIVARSELSAGGMDSRQEESWAQEIRRRLDKRVSFEFVQTPLSEAVQFLQNLTKVNMILDPVAIKDVGDAPITLRVSQMKLELALDWILRLAGLQYMLKDNAIFISKPENLTTDIALKIYDVRDLIMKVPNFPGPDFALDLGTNAFGQGGLGGIAISTQEQDEGVTVESLSDMISTRIKPESWSPDLGTSIEQSNGKLIVMQRPEIHRMIDKLLSSLRSTQKLQVTVEGRVLMVREGFFEEIGFDWTGLNSVPVASGVVPANRIGTNGRLWTSDTFNPDVAVNPNLNVTSGLVRRATGFAPGDMSVAGAISNYRPQGSPEEGTIGNQAEAATNWSERLAGGLNAQYVYLSNMEAMAFMHLLNQRQAGTILTAPRLTVFNTQRAHMFVAEQQSYVADYDISGGIYDPIIRQFLQGVVFEVRPIVSSDRRYITLEMRPTLATLILMDSIMLSGYSIVGDNPPTFIAMLLPVDFPVLELRKVRTTVTLPDGGLVLLGGLMQNIKFNSENGIPFISNIPIIGRLFRWTVQDNEKRNLSIMVRAKLLMFEEEERKL